MKDKKQANKGYTSAQTSELLQKYVDLSAERLRARIKLVWKKQSPVKIIPYEKASV